MKNFPAKLFYRVIYSSSILLWIFSSVSPGSAQVVRDRTLQSPSRVRLEQNTFVITGGTRRGNSLFHSFQQFSPGDRAASFQGVGSAIDNVFARVTGSEVSRINGAIEVLQPNGSTSSANLFLLNPNGILFGAHASLNLGGSFLATTANQINFNDNIRFSATDPQPLPLLRISTPVGIQFGNRPGSIVDRAVPRLDNQGNLVLDAQGNLIGGLQVQPGQTLALLGGTLQLPGGWLIAGGDLTAAGGQIELGSVSHSGEVLLTQTGRDLKFSYDQSRDFNDISVSNFARLDASGVGGGSVQVYGRSIAIDNSLILTNTYGNQNGHRVLIHAAQLALDHRAFVAASTIGAGRGGNIRIQADQLAIRHAAQVEANVGDDYDGQITRATGQGGNLSVTADNIQVDGRDSGLFARPAAEDTTTRSRSGNLLIATNRLSVSGGGQISTTNLGAGRSGRLTVQASDIELTGVALNRNGTPILQNRLPVVSALVAGTTSIGRGGDLSIETQRLNLQDGAVLQTSTLSSGNAGNLRVQADQISVSGIAPGGRFPTGILALSGGIPGTRFGGFPDATGNGGSLSLTARSLSVQDGAVIATGSLNPTQEVRAGDLTVNANSVTLNDQAGLLANTNSGNGGSMSLEIQRLLVLRQGSEISATAGSASRGGNGGNIAIDAGNGFIVSVPFENSDITANAFSGSGGNVEITTQGTFGLVPRSRADLKRLLGTQDSTQLNPRRLNSNDITAISQTNPSLNGQVTLNDPNVDPTQGLAELPAVPIAQEPTQGCQVSGTSTAEFFSTGRGGLPPTPYEPLRNSDILDDLRLPAQEPATSTGYTESQHTESRQLVEAQGWHVNPRGAVVLVAEIPSGRLQSQCHLR
jgi:filamentous hemagglutinin family protein